MDETFPGNSTSAEAPRPGGELQQRPLEINGELYDPLDPPNLVLDGQGQQTYQGGTKLDKDAAYAAKFWEQQPAGMRDVMVEEIEKAANGTGFLASFVSSEGIDERAKAKLSAYRTLARGLGYEVGDFVLNPQSGTVQASITKPVS